MNTLKLPIGKSLYQEADKVIRNKLERTFDRYHVDDNKEVLGESLLRLDIINQSARINLTGNDLKSNTLFEMFSYFKSL
jgi:hypothetical protein